ncbi:MAG TPA: DUF433 domain-containing protein [Solirubrobacteraceae bacterium]|nr:DUF433 domain-containing protein [Solirubrobacteraceae bacterium]
MLTRREAAELVHVPVGALDKAIEQKVVTALRRGNATWLRSEDVGVLALLQSAAFPLPIAVKRKIKRWVRDTKPYRARRPSELPISDALVVRWSSELTETVQAAESYARLRDKWIETDPSIKGGEPIIRGTRLGARAVAQRLEHGDTVATLVEDYPDIPVEAFLTAYTYARAHPRRGRPAKPWRGGDEALGRRGSVPVAG